MEFEKICKGKKLRLAKIPFDKLPEILINQAEAMVFNQWDLILFLIKNSLRRFLADKNDIMIIRQVAEQAACFYFTCKICCMCYYMYNIEKQWEADGNGH